MAVFITLETDAFASNFNAAVASAQQTMRAGVSSVRRPQRGLEIREDTYAVLRVVQSDGTPVPLIDSGSPTGQNTQYSNFILQSVQEARMEKHQIVETFGEPYIYFFGESPRFLDVTAVLVDSNDFNWYAEFWANYNAYFRGTKLVEMGARAYLFYDDNIVEGYMLNATARKTSDTPLMVMLQFRLYLTNYSNITIVGDAANPDFPVPASVELPPDVSTTAGSPYAVSPPTNPNNLVAQNTAASQAAQIGAQQQQSGFGGGQSLSNALRQGMTSTGSPTVDSYLQAAAAASGNPGSRTLPLRGLISDNTDEWTGDPAQYPPPPSTDPTSTYFDQEDDTAGQPDAYDLPSALQGQAGNYGVDSFGPDDYDNLGLLPTFSAASGFGVGVSVGLSASFGAGAGPSASFGQSASSGFGAGYYGGINGGLGFTGGFTSYSSASLVIQPPNVVVALSEANLGVGFNNGVFANGIPIAGGVSQGTGIGGGVPFGVSGGIGPNGPGTLPQFTGGTSYSSPGGFSSSQGYGVGMSAVGASVSVGGSPSLFSTSVVSGTLNPAGSTSLNYFIGPDGSVSETNSTGLYV